MFDSMLCSSYLHKKIYQCYHKRVYIYTQDFTEVQFWHTCPEVFNYVHNKTFMLVFWIHQIYVALHEYFTWKTKRKSIVT